MSKIQLEEIRLTGISLKQKTTNSDGQSKVDCGNLWQKFREEKYADKIPGKLTDEILAVYHGYEGDYTQPFSYFIGCKVKPGSGVPQSLDSLVIPPGTYFRMEAKGKMPGCVENTWNEIWGSDIPRSYQMDFEVYGEKSRDWNNAEVDIFLSVR